MTRKIKKLPRRQSSDIPWPIKNRLPAKKHNLKSKSGLYSMNLLSSRLNLNINVYVYLNIVLNQMCIVEQ